MERARIEHAVSEAVGRLAAAFSPMAIYQFGSSLPGRSAEPGDLDLVVVVPSSSESFYARGARAYKALIGLGVPVDVQVYTRAEFESRAAWPASFEERVQAEGRKVYAA